MNSHLSIKFFKTKGLTLFIQSGVSVFLLLGLASCSVFSSNDYSIKDSLYVWSDLYAESNETDIEYQTIRSLEDSILKSDVELIFEEMVNNEIAEIELESEASNNEIAKVDIVKKEIVKKEIASDTSNNDEIIQPQEVEVAVTPIENNISPETETTLVAHYSQDDSQEEIESIEDINRVTQENPTAAGAPVNKVLPVVKTEVAEIELPNELLLLASSTDYQSEVNEYGMWQLSKNNDSLYQEVCSLSSSTMQVELENYATQVWLTVVGNDLLVNSTTNIDIAQPRVGLKFDNGSLQAFNKNYFQTSAVWSGNLESALKNNKQLSIRLGGNELGKRTQELAIGLTDLKKAYSEYRKCNSGTQIGSL